jgi:flagellar protein FlbT
MALRLTLKPGERAIIGEAVVRNGRSRVHLLVENEVPVLRESDIVLPNAVGTPCERIYLALQLVYVDPGKRAEHLEALRVLTDELIQAAPSFRPLVDQTLVLVAGERFYQALKSAQRLREHERELLTR